MRDWFRRTWPSLMLYVVAGLVLGEIVAFAVLIPLVSRVSSQARSGQQAKVTQCLRNPVSQKLAVAAFEVRFSLPREARVTAEELADFKRTAPKDCPPKKK